SSRRRHTRSTRDWSSDVCSSDLVRRLVEALAADPDLILFVDELHNLIGQGTAIGAAMDAANMLKPALVRGDIRVIGATTGEEYRSEERRVGKARGVAGQRDG